MTAVEAKKFTFNYYVEKSPTGSIDLSLASRAVDNALRIEFLSYEARLLNEELGVAVPAGERIWQVRNCVLASRHSEDNQQFDLSVVSLRDNSTLFSLRQRLPVIAARALGRVSHADEILKDLPLEVISYTISLSALRAVEMRLGT